MAVILWCALLIACSGDHPTRSAPAVEPVESETTLVKEQAAAYTYYRGDGNRLIEGRCSLPQAPFIDIALDGEPQWVVAAATGRSSVWAVVLDDGRVQAFRLADGVYAPVAVGGDMLAIGAPPALGITGGLRPQLLGLTEGEIAPFTHPILLAEGRLAYIASDGDLVLVDGTDRQRLALDAMLDARILVDEDERLLLYNLPTGRYGHGVLGDAIEAGGVALVATQGGLRTLAQIEFAAPLVAEGIMPTWIDWDGDGRRDIVVTLSDDSSGARVAAFGEDGSSLGMGEAFSQGFRWRHQIAFAPFASDGVEELAVVRTPHIGGVVEFYRRRGNEMERVAQLGGYTSHVIGTRNLDMALAGDFDGDGALEVLLPNQELTHLGAVGRRADGARLIWQVEIGSRATTNLAAAALDDGRLLVGIGGDGQFLRVWGP
jgi:PAS domain-containing protein